LGSAAAAFEPFDAFERLAVRSGLAAASGVVARTVFPARCVFAARVGFAAGPVLAAGSVLAARAERVAEVPRAEALFGTSTVTSTRAAGMAGCAAAALMEVAAIAAVLRPLSDAPFVSFAELIVDAPSVRAPSVITDRATSFRSTRRDVSRFERGVVWGSLNTHCAMSSNGEIGHAVAFLVDAVVPRCGASLRRSRHTARGEHVRGDLVRHRLTMLRGLDSRGVASSARGGTKKRASVPVSCRGNPDGSPIVVPLGSLD
jgi:hypothetical protein